MKTGIGFWLRPMLRRYSLREHEKRFVRGSEPQIHSERITQTNAHELLAPVCHNKVLATGATLGMASTTVPPCV